MARGPRIDFTGAHHVINRVLNCLDIFISDEYDTVLFDNVYLIGYN